MKPVVGLRLSFKGAVIPTSQHGMLTEVSPHDTSLCADPKLKSPFDTNGDFQIEPVTIFARNSATINKMRGLGRYVYLGVRISVSAYEMWQSSSITIQRMSKFP